MDRSSGRAAVWAVALTLLVLAAGGLAFIYSGAYDIAASAGHTPVVRWLLETTVDRSIASHARAVPDPIALDSAALAHGFEHYRAMCVDCHGAPGLERGEVGQGLTPAPPDLADEADLSARELFWVIKHGIKLAGMPAFGPTHSDEALWSIVGFVARLRDMDAAEYALWEERYAASVEAAEEAEGASGHSHPPGTPAHSH